MLLVLDVAKKKYPLYFVCILIARSIVRSKATQPNTRRQEGAHAGAEALEEASCLSWWSGQVVFTPDWFIVRCDAPHCRKLNISWMGGRQNLSIAARSLQTRIVEQAKP